MYDLKDKSIIVTGGGSGIGREAAVLAAKAGARITVADINVAEGEETVGLIRGQRGTAHFVRTDVSQEAQCEVMVAAAVSAYGRLDGAFNNAGVPQSNAVMHEITMGSFQRCMNVNVVGVFLCMKHEIAAMLKTGGGAIVNTASAGGMIAFPAAAEYVTSKHAVVGLTKAAAVDYGTRAIRVNALCPGATLTPMLVGAVAQAQGLEEYLIAQQPVGRLAQPFEMARVAVWLLSDHASFMTGAAIAADGGYTAK